MPSETSLSGGASASKLSLAAEFPAPTEEQWRSAVAGVLAKSGADFDSLVTQTLDGPIQPLYTAEDVAALPPTGLPGQAPFVRGATAEGSAAAGWDVRQHHCDPDAKSMNAAVLDDLANGATSVWLRLGPDRLDPAELAVALDGVYLDLAPVVLDAGAMTVEATDALLSLAASRGVAPAELRGSLGADPIGDAARFGGQSDLAVLAELAEKVRDYPNLQIATVAATVVHLAGANDTQELAYATAVGVAYLRALTAAGLTVDEALDRIEFRFAVTDSQFASIAKLRAARLLWARVSELSGSSLERGQRQHAVTSGAMLTQRDPWVNMLRSTIAAFAAAIGGAEAITVLPFDSAVGLPDDFARRIARNTQSILHDESSLARVIDAGGGSWYIESLTQHLAAAAWEQFTAIERVGGAAVSLAAGAFATDVETTRAARQEEVAQRSMPITGVSEFALITEDELTRRPVTAREATGDFTPHRYSEDFEALRDRADAFLASTGSRPKLFLAALGPASVHTARLGFATNLYQAAGIDVVIGTGTPDEIVSSFTASGTSVATLCSSDRFYATEAAAAGSSLKAAGAKYLGLAGQPGDRVESDRSAGIDGYIYAGVDVLNALSTTLDLLGVER
ncbi:MAG TPA: methylmalonyl-CoA mutase family protein [Jatrophihabitans sp.]